MIQFDPGAKVISWLPAAHIAERMAHHYIPVIYAGHDHVLPEPARGAVVPAAGPADLVLRGAADLGEAQGRARDDAGGPARGAAPARAGGRRGGDRTGPASSSAARPCHAELEAKVAQADEQMFSKLREMLGLDQVIAVNVGAAPTPVEVLEFFHALGIELAELWGMSETCGVGTCNRPGEVKIGTVGPAEPGVEIKIADDGELLVRGGCVMTGLPQRAGARRPRRSTRTDGSTPATSARSTRTASCGSSTARRRSSSTRPARTCRRPTSRPRSRPRVR